jgi:hypothetical protein
MNKLLKVSMLSVFALVLILSAGNVFAARWTQQDAAVSDGNSRSNNVSYITASPLRVNLGGSSVISWDARPSGATRCWDLPSYKSLANYGKRTVSPTMTGQYGIMCEDPIDGKGYSGWVEITVIDNVSGSISATDCAISVGSNSCDSTISWDVPYYASISTTPRGTIVLSSTPTTQGSTTYPVSYGNRTFYLYHNGTGVLLDSATAKASCASGTSWNGSVCGTSNPYNSQVQSQYQSQPNTATEQYRSWKSYSMPTSFRSFSSWRNSYSR